MFGFAMRRWEYILLFIVVVDVLIVGALYYIFTTPDSQAEAETAAAQPVPVVLLPTVTPWPGPPTSTPTPDLPPTPTPTPVLGAGGFPAGFTPTPRPTPEPVTITLPKVYFGNTRRVDVPVINQIQYPEPFFPPGTNNACGPVSLYAAIQGLGVNVSYTHLRNIAVNNGFGAQGISKWGLVNTAITLNSELGSPLRIEYGDRYRTRDLLNRLRRGGVVLVLVHLRKYNGQYRLTAEVNGTIGHFLLVESINFRTQRVKLAGSTLGMDEVSLTDFLRSWTHKPDLVVPATSWKSYLDNEPATNWALILKRSSK